MSKKTKKRKTSKSKKSHQDDIQYDYHDLGDTQSSQNKYGWAPYRSVASRKADAEALVEKLAKKGKILSPVTANGRKISNTFWGQAWCRNLEEHHDYESRLPRGRSYLRNGSVIDLKISTGKIIAQVIGSYLYKVQIDLEKMDPISWNKIIEECAGSIGSVLELLAGKVSEEVLAIITSDESHLFPKYDEIKMNCSCPDWATMCKHVAAVLYGVGARLDESPQLFFVLRGVDHNDLIRKSSKKLVDDVDAAAIKFDSKELEALFGIEISLN